MKDSLIIGFKIFLRIGTFIGFSYEVVYQWFYISHWETMNIILKIILIVIFIILYYLYIKSFIYKIKRLRIDHKW